MKRTLDGGFEIDDDRERVDVAAVHRFLSSDAYWALGRSLETVERLIADATRVVAIYDAERLVAFARTVSDGVSFGWLADVFVLPEYRGRGLGVELVRAAVVDTPVKPRRWILGTADAHSLYERFGFTKPSDRLMVWQVDPEPPL